MIESVITTIALVAFVIFGPAAALVAALITYGAGKVL